MESPEPFLDLGVAENPDRDGPVDRDPTRWQYWLEDAHDHLSQAINDSGSAVMAALDLHETVQRIRWADQEDPF